VNQVRRGRPPLRFAIQRIRLVGFHNLVDETIEIRDGGHLFLLGDNGSGKTTVLDAIHLVLTGTLGIELNAAARVAGGRSENGRSLQGIVLRFDQERGVVNEGGAIAYAVLELAEVTGGTPILAGVGVEATTMDADVTRWGFLVRGRLEEVPVVETTSDGTRAVPREVLRARLDKLDFFARMSDFRRALAERLFGGPAPYEDVCRFWSMAKAYREIVARARDFAGLFSRLLPAPNRDTFADILRSARALDELEDTLAQLDEQRKYVAGLAELAESIRAARETIARYRWLLTFRRVEDAKGALDATRGKLAQRRRDADEAAAALELTRAGVQAAEAARHSAQAADAEGLGLRLRTAEAQLERERADVRQCESDVAACDARVDDAARTLAQREAVRTALWAGLIADAKTRADRARDLTSPFAAVGAALSREEAHVVSDEEILPPIPDDALQEVDQAVRAADTALRQREREHVACEARAVALRGSLSTLQAQDEETPRVAGFAAARAALAQAGIAARPIYEALEPKAGALPRALAALEALLGDAALAAFIVEPGDVGDRARAVVLPHRDARVVVRVADEAALPSWVRELFAARTDATALAALATALSQPTSLGDVPPVDALGDLEHRGVAHRSHADAPRLIGLEARRRAHEARLSELRAEVRGAETSLEAAAATVHVARRRLDDVTDLRAALAALRGEPLLRAHHDLRAATAESARAIERREAEQPRLDQAASRARDAEHLLDVLRARARDAGLDEIERRIAELKERERRAHDEERVALQRHVTLDGELNALADEERDAVTRVDALHADLDALAGTLRARLTGALAASSDAELEHYVRVTQRGDQFKSAAHIEERLRAAERDELVACSEIAGDGSRGVRHLQWAGRFGFAWFSDECRIEDRRGEPLANVLARIAHDIEGQRRVINDKTRELMDKLVMGALARELQEHVEGLHRTVRDINSLLQGLRFGATLYQFRVTPRSERAELVQMVRKLSVVDEDSRARFRQFVDERLEEIKRLDDETELPELLDYRRWFDYRLAMRSTGANDTELTRELRALGSGGEQGGPNYLLVLALARLMFDNADARVRPLLFDEAFYGIDAGRRDQLLRFATDLGIQLVVASPDQDGVTPSARRATTLFLVKDSEGDVHLAPYHYWNDAHVAQRSLLSDRPDEAPAADAVCAVANAPEPVEDQG